MIGDLCGLATVGGGADRRCLLPMSRGAGLSLESEGICQRGNCDGGWRWGDRPEAAAAAAGGR